ncbi:MAG: type I-C CRISPR-associated protein Cas5c [Clostridia bacterium]|jgi:CRISPR-associated protein Cas5d|nr:type I-C CRISPR-associated protein Cas5c [bacterium]
MGYGFKVMVWGDYACFTRPEMKVERVSYDVMTPSAARGILQAIYWKPEIEWIVDKICVINPIQFIDIRRNEVSSKISTEKVRSAVNGNDELLYLDTSFKTKGFSERQQRASKVLKNVCYIIEAHFDVNNKSNIEEEKKHYNIALRRMQNGECYNQPYLGTREFSANFKLVDNVQISQLKGEVDLGYMLYDLKFKPKCGDINYNDAEPMFFRPKMIDGLIDVGFYKKEAGL